MLVNIKVTGGWNIESGQIDPNATQGLNNDPELQRQSGRSVPETAGSSCGDFPLITQSGIVLVSRDFLFAGEGSCYYQIQIFVINFVLDVTLLRHYDLHIV